MKNGKINRIIFTYIVLLLVFINSSCSKNDDIVGNTNSTMASESKNVYGFSFVNRTWGFVGLVPYTSWVGGGAQNSFESVCVSGKDLYIATYVSGYDAKHVFKNGVQCDTLAKGDVSTMIVSGGNVYTCGSYENAQRISIAAYWKNGKVIELTNGKSNCYASCIFVSENDVYVCGYEFLIGEYNNCIPKYWKNGIPINLTNGLTRSLTKSIAVLGKDVYVLEKDGMFYWKNGLLNSVPYSDGEPASSIMVSGLNVYFLFNTHYSKNNQIVYPETSTYGKDGNMLYSIFIDGSDDYVCGTVYSYKGTRLNVSSPTYWKNGKLYYFAKYTEGTESAHLICVK